MYKNSSIIAFFLIFGQLLSIIRERLLVQFVGIGPLLDVYNASFKIPDLIFGIVAGFVGASTIVPFISRSHAVDDHDDKNVRLNSAFFVFGFLTTILSVIIFFTLPYITKYFASNFTAEQNTDLILYTRILLLQPFLLGLSTLISNIAQMKEKFLIFSIAPLLYTTGNIFGVIYLFKQFGLIGIIYGVILGAVAHLLFQSITLKGSKLKLSFSNFNLKVVREHFRLAIPRTGTLLLFKIRDLLYTSFAISFGPAVLSTYILAQKLIDVPVNIFTQSLASSSLPKLSVLHEKDDHSGHKKLFYQNFFLLFILSSSASIFIYLFIDLLAKIVYGFNVPGIEEVIGMTKMLTVGIVFFSCGWYVRTALNSRKITKIDFYINLFALICAVIIYYILKFNLSSYSTTFSSYMKLAITINSMQIISASTMFIYYYRKYLR